MQSPNNLAGKGGAKKPLIKNLRVKNFTCFENLELTNCGRANLLLADNGCGKTNLLRAIDLMYCKKVDNQTPANKTEQGNTGKAILYDYALSQALHYITEELLTGSIPSSTIAALQKFNTKDWFEVCATYYDESSYSLTKDDVEFCLANSIPELKKYNALKKYSYFGLYTETRWQEYIFAMAKTLQHSIDFEALAFEIVKTFKDNVSAVRGSDDYLLNIFCDNSTWSTPLAIEGYGLKRIVIAILLIAASTGIALIDEAENGLHYNRYEDFAKMILKSAELANTQVFITTHSREFAKVFLQTAAKFKKPDSDTTFNEDVKTYRLYKKGNGVVAADYGNATASLDEIDFNNNSFTRDV